MAKKKITIELLQDYVLVKPDKIEKVSAGGIIIPDNAKEKPQKGTVVVVGPGKKDHPMHVKKGDCVLFSFSEYSSKEIPIGDEAHLIIRESDIYAIFK